MTGIIYLVMAMSALASIAQEPFPFSQRCDLQTAQNPSTSFGTCMEPGKLDGKSFAVPKNVTRIDRTGTSLCLPVEYGAVKAADVVFVVDWSGSMKGNDKSWYTPKATRQAMELLHTLAPQSTGGWISFAGDVCKDLPLKPLNEGANLQNLVAQTNYGMEVSDCNGNEFKRGTNWYASLSLARKWLMDGSMTKHNTKAIVFLTDGLPSYDFKSETTPDRKHLIPLYEQLIQEPDFPPVHAIFIAGKSTELENLTTRTGGGFYPVAPNDPTGLQTAMNNIVQAVVGSRKPTRVQLTNLENGMSATADESAMQGAGIGQWQLQLTDLIPLREGDNRIRLEYEADKMMDGKVTLEKESAQFTLKVSSAAQEQSGKKDLPESPFAVSCQAPSSLKVTDAGGKMLERLPHSSQSYGLELRTNDAQLTDAKVKVNADASRDSENLTLKSASGKLAGAQPFAGTGGAGSSDNGITEAQRKDQLSFTWTHPRDPRDKAYLEIGILDDKEPALVEALFIPEVNAFRKGNLDTLQVVFSEPVKAADKTDRFFTVKGEKGVYHFQLRPLHTDGVTIRFLVTRIEEVSYPTQGDSIRILAGFFTSAGGKTLIGDPGNDVMLKVRAPVAYFKIDAGKEIPSISNETSEQFGDRSFLINLVHPQAELSTSEKKNVAGIGSDQFKSLVEQKSGTVVEFRVNQGFVANVSIFSHLGEFVNETSFEVQGEAFSETDTEGNGLPIRMIWNGKSSSGHLVGHGVYIFRIAMKYKPKGAGKTKEEVKVVRVGLLRGGN